MQSAGSFKAGCVGNNRFLNELDWQKHNIGSRGGWDLLSRDDIWSSLDSQALAQLKVIAQHAGQIELVSVHKGSFLSLMSLKGKDTPVFLGLQWKIVRRVPALWRCFQAEQSWHDIIASGRALIVWGICPVHDSHIFWELSSPHGVGQGSRLVGPLPFSWTQGMVPGVYKVTWVGLIQFSLWKLQHWGSAVLVGF